MRYLGRDPEIQSSVAKLNLETNVEVTIVDADQSGTVDSQKIVVGKDLESRELMALVNQGARHVIQMPNLDFERQMAFCLQILSQPKTFFAQPQRFFTANNNHCLIQSPRGFFHYPLEMYPDKDSILARISQDLLGVAGNDSARLSATVIADEMLMNLIKDAPKYFHEEFPHLDPSGRKSSFSMAFNEDRLLLWTEDDFGSLVVSKLIRRLQESYQEEKVRPILEEGRGAGIGCRIIFDMCVSMSMFVKPGEKTIFCALLPLRMTNKRRQTMPKNLHILSMTF